MADDLSVAIERLRTSTQRLNETCDSAAQTVREVETFLDESHVGLPAVVHVKYVWDGRDRVDVSLGYIRSESGRFRIAVITAEANSEELDFDAYSPTYRPWSECTRDEKLETFEKLPELLLELSKRIAERTTKAEQVVVAVNASLSLSKKRKGG